MATRPPSIKVRALQWLAQREHSRSELRRKLLRLLARADIATTAANPSANASRRAAGYPGDDARGDGERDGCDGAATTTAAAEVDALLDWLEARGYLSQSRFAESRINARQGRYGNLHITRELAQHGVDLDASAALTLKDSELDRARAVWCKKYGQRAADTAGRMRQMRFLSGRGFSPEVIRRVMRDDGDDGN